MADLDAFAAVARTRNFRAAGKLHGVSPSSLSDAVRRLEERLGVRLFHRTTRSVTLTDAGSRLMDRVSPLLSELETALDDVNNERDRPAGRLRLNVPGIVARSILPPILTEFLTRYPEIRVELKVDDALVDVLAEGHDAGVRYEESLHQDMIAVPIGPRRQRYVCVASPDYLARHGRPRHPRNLLDGHHAILHRFANGRVLQWTFERDDETISVTPPARLVAESVEVETAAACAGLGMICTFEDFVHSEIDSGALVPVLEDWLEPFSGPYLYYPSHRFLPSPLRAFVDFIREQGKNGRKDSS